MQVHHPPYIPLSHSYHSTSLTHFLSIPLTHSLIRSKSRKIPTDVCVPVYSVLQRCTGGAEWGCNAWCADVSLEVMSQFPRIKSLTSDPSMIVCALKQSTRLVVRRAASACFVRWTDAVIKC
jgi:hypothetical protein